MQNFGRGTDAVEKMSKKDRQIIITQYASSKPRKLVQEELAEYFNVSERMIRYYANVLGLNVAKGRVSPDKVMVYDIETSLIKADIWNTGKQYIRHNQLVNGKEGETRIISIAWKFVGEDEVYALTWDKNHCDKAMIEEFLLEYNASSMVIGQNNNSFDNKIVTTRAAKHDLFVDRFVKSFDIYRMAKRCFRLPSYSMAYMAGYFGLTLKQSHEGIRMWHMIQEGTEAEQKEYMDKMVKYNKGDIVTTEELYMKLKPYFSTVTNNAVATGKPKWACPVSGSTDVELHKTIFTEAGTVQRILFCNESKHQYKVNNKIYMDFLQRAMLNE